MTPPQESLSDLREAVRGIHENLLLQAELLESVMDSLERRESDQRQTTSSGEGRVAAWRPPEEVAATIGHPQKTNTHEVKSQPSGSDIFTSLRHSWVGRIYTDHLKQILLIRNTVIAAWRTFYPLYVRFSVFLASQQARRWRPIVKLQDYVSESKCPSIRAFDSETVETPPPIVAPEENQANLVSPHCHYKFPEIYVVQLGGATISGGTNLVLFKDFVVCHDLYDFERDYTSEELHGRHIIDYKKRCIRLLRYDAVPEKFDEAAAFVDACAPNYAHWLTEVLPRIVAFCSLEKYARVPIIVNDGLHRNIMESLVLAVGYDRTIITLPVGRSIIVGVAYITSVAGYVPFERRNRRLDGHSHGVFSPAAFSEMRRILVDAVKATPCSDWPRKIYLRRNSGVRKVLNSSEIERALIAHGYAVIEPEKLSFTQQVLLFSRVEAVVASSGAAVANIIFCPPGTRITILIGRFPDTSYWYWQNIAAASGNIVRYVLCETALGSPRGIHADFHVNVEDLFKSLENS